MTVTQPYKYMSRSQPNQPPTFTSFADLCLLKDILPEGERHTVEVLLEIAGTSDYNLASEILSNCAELNLQNHYITDISLVACDRLEARYPDAQIWIVRVGSRHVRRFGGRTRRTA